jgi:N-acetylglutamate synthase
MAPPRLPSRFDPEVSFLLEELAFRAWPADEVEEVEGWRLRRTEGVDRRRSNSLLPPPDSAHALRTLDLALATAEEVDIAPVIHVSPAEVHLRLDDALEAQGMTRSGPSLVLAGPLLAATEARRAAVSVSITGLTERWRQAWIHVSGQQDDPAGMTSTAELVLSQLTDRAAFAIAHDAASGEPVGAAVGVAENGWLGLFSLTTSPSFRRTGIATQLINALSAWAADRGARSTYLQVETTNTAALALYARRHFWIAHSYHYRSA